eukprot:1088859-Prymnesium_polylepis.2
MHERRAHGNDSHAKLVACVDAVAGESRKPGRDLFRLIWRVSSAMAIVTRRSAGGVHAAWTCVG